MQRVALLVALGLALCVAPFSSAQDKVDDEGFIRNWLMLAPIPLGDDAGADALDKQQVAGEANLKAVDGEKVKVGDKTLTWKAVKAKEYFVDINETLGEPVDQGIAYLVAFVESPDEKKDVTVLMGSNDEGKVYLNGKEILKFAETRVLDKDTEKAEKQTLNKGTNVVVFKVINESNNWQACLRFTDASGKPLKDLTVKTKQ
jgi:hypothetical protein